jgi:hypothetical protein
MAQRITAHEALSRANWLLNPNRLDPLQELVFLGIWQEKPYAAIALETGYNLDSIKQASTQILRLLTESTGQRITKKNIRSILSHYPIPETLIATDGTEQPLAVSAVEVMEFPDGAVPLHSQFYIERKPIDAWAYAEIAMPGSLLRIKAPRQWGKTSLVHRILSHATELGFSTALINLQTSDRAIFNSLNDFLRWFCLNVSQQLHLEAKLETYWNPQIGSKVSCTLYLQDYLLQQAPCPIVLALDELHQIFEFPLLAKDVLPLLRFWHEEGTRQEIWQKLRLVVAHSTDVYVPLNLNQSPFNLGLPLELPAFTPEQVIDLAQRYKLDEMGLYPDALKPLITLVGGHPYLIRLALYWLRKRRISLEQLLKEAPTPTGIYADHLRRHWNTFQRYPELGAAFQQVIAIPGGVRLESKTAYRLESMGLVKLNGHTAMLSCDLYRLYFSSQFLAEEPLDEL